MEFKDYYKVMGVARDATEAQIKQAYRKLARKYHPDVSKEPDAEARFKEVGGATRCSRAPRSAPPTTASGRVRAPAKSSAHPRTLGPDSNSREPARRAAARITAIFSSRCSAGRRGPQRGRHHFDTGRGEDHHAKIMLDLQAALHGGSRSFTLRVPELDAEGRLAMQERVLNVQIPKGILPGQTIRLAGQGSRGHEAPGQPASPAGDLYIEVEFQPHPLYRIDGRDLYLELPVTPWEAALGASVKTPTPGGVVDLKIPAGSHAGTKLRLKGRGMPASPAGDFYVVLQIALPPAADEKAKAAYRTMADAMPFNPRASLGV